MANVKADLSGLESMLKKLKSNKSVKIGILGSDAKQQHDSKSGLTNAELGTVHEFGAKINHPGGTPYKIIGEGKALFVKKSEGAGLPVTKPHTITIPRRSFLYDPLMEKLGDLIKSRKKEAWKAYFVKNKPEDFLALIGSRGLAIVRQAFTMGFPGWQPLTASTVRQKQRMGYSPNTLVTTGQGGLSSSVSFEVVDK